MALKSSLLGGTSFAHLVGLTRPAAAAPIAPSATKAEDEGAEEEDARAENDEAENPEEDDPKKGKRAKKAKKKPEDDREDTGEEDTDGDDDSDGEEARADSPHYAARQRERARCASIFRDAAAAGNPALAAQLAFGTSLSRSEAVAVLKTGGTAATPRRSLNDRMQSAAIPAVGPDAPSPAAQGAEAVAAEIVKNYEQARGLVSAK